MDGGGRLGLVREGERCELGLGCGSGRWVGSRTRRGLVWFGLHGDIWKKGNVKVCATWVMS